MASASLEPALDVQRPSPALTCPPLRQPLTEAQENTYLLTWLGRNPSAQPSNGQEPARLIGTTHMRILPAQNEKQNQN
jgi:hypothetical protein